MLIIWAVVSVTACWAQPTGVEFEILRDGSPVGTDRVEITDRGDTTIVHRTIEITITMIGLTLYEYRHEDREVWREDSLVRLNAQTNDNGEEYFVDGHRQGDTFVWESKEGTRHLMGEVIPTSYWNKRLVSQDQLLDTQHGRILDIQVERGDTETIPVKNGPPIQARPYHLSGELELTIWYDSQDRWSRIRFKRSGSTFTYRLVKFLEPGD